MAFNSHYKLAPDFHPGVTDPHQHFHLLTCQLPESGLWFDHSLTKGRGCIEGDTGACANRRQQEIQGELMVKVWEPMSVTTAKGGKTDLGKISRKDEETKLCWRSCCEQQGHRYSWLT